MFDVCCCFRVDGVVFLLFMFRKKKVLLCVFLI